MSAAISIALDGAGLGDQIPELADDDEKQELQMGRGLGVVAGIARRSVNLESVAEVVDGHRDFGKQRDDAAEHVEDGVDDEDRNYDDDGDEQRGGG